MSLVSVEQKTSQRISDPTQQILMTLLLSFCSRCVLSFVFFSLQISHESVKFCGKLLAARTSQYFNPPLSVCRVSLCKTRNRTRQSPSFIIGLVCDLDNFTRLLLLLSLQQVFIFFCSEWESRKAKFFHNLERKSCVGNQKKNFESFS